MSNQVIIKANTPLSDDLLVGTVSPWELTFERQCMNCCWPTEQIQIVNQHSKPLFWNCLTCGYPNPLDAPTT